MEFFLNHVSRTIPKIVPISRPIPTAHLREILLQRGRRLEPDQVDGEHKNDSHHVVDTFDHDRHDRGARPDSFVAHWQHDRSNHFPALPIKKTVPKPTVVAAKRSPKRDDTNGRSNAPHLKALTTYDKLTMEAAANRRYGLEWLTASRTSAQFNFRPNHQNRTPASRHSPMNSRYFRYFCIFKFPDRVPPEIKLDLSMGQTTTCWAVRTGYYSLLKGQESIPSTLCA